jgi:hypothetical protein
VAFGVGWTIRSNSDVTPSNPQLVPSYGSSPNPQVNRLQECGLTDFERQVPRSRQILRAERF